MRDSYKKDENSSTLTKKETLALIISYFAKYKIRISLIVTLVVIMSLIVALIPLFTKHAVDVDIQSKDAKGLLITISIASFLCFLWWVLSVVKQHLLANITNEIIYKIRKETYYNVLNLSLDYFDSRPSGRTLSRLVGDIESLKTVVTELVNTLIPNLFLLLSIIVIMSFNNMALAIAPIATIPILSFSSYWIIFKGYYNWENYRKKESNHTSFVYEDYSGIKTIQSYKAEEDAQKEEEKLLFDIISAWKKAVRFGDSLNIITLFCQGLGYFILFLIAVKFLKVGPESIGDVLAYISYMGLFWQPIRSLASMYTQLVNNLSSASRVFELMNERPSLNENANSYDIEISEGSVRFDSVSFSYPDEKDKLVLDDVSFFVKGGKHIALVGPTGAGKTTIINLIARFYDPTKGKIFIDDQDISKVTVSSLRRNIALMPQDSMLFSSTVRENLLYSNDASEEKMYISCKRIGIDSMIENLPNGYDTRIDEISLSQGQKQLLALARTLISSPKILILDEATSNIDTNTEIMVQRGMKILMEGRTVFTIAHRLSTIIDSDCIFVISDKGIKEMGSHSELLKKGGEYKALYDAQFAICH